jgi:hypothetical protein
MKTRLKELAPEFPAEMIGLVTREIIETLAGALSTGRQVALRGFGRFQPRRYQKSTKRLGLIFRPSPELLARLNPRNPAPPADESAENI